MECNASGNNSAKGFLQWLCILCALLVNFWSKIHNLGSFNSDTIILNNSLQPPFTIACSSSHRHCRLFSYPSTTIEYWGKTGKLPSCHQIGGVAKKWPLNPNGAYIRIQNYTVSMHTLLYQVVESRNHHTGSSGRCNGMCAQDKKVRTRCKARWWVNSEHHVCVVSHVISKSVPGTNILTTYLHTMLNYQVRYPVLPGYQLRYWSRIPGILWIYQQYLPVSYHRTRIIWRIAYW